MRSESGSGVKEERERERWAGQRPEGRVIDPYAPQKERKERERGLGVVRMSLRCHPQLSGALTRAV